MDNKFEQIYEGAVNKGKIPEKLFQDTLDGANAAIGAAESLLQEAIQKYGKVEKVAYPDTAYALPVIRALSGEELYSLADLESVLEKAKINFSSELTLNNVLAAGEATLYAAEIIEALRYVKDLNPNVEPYTGFLSDPVLRSYGVKLVDWTIPGVAVIVGKAQDSKAAKKLVADLMSKGLMIFLCDDIIEQLLAEKVKLGKDYIAFPLGKFTQVIHAVNFALRAGMTFGGIAPGKRQEIRDYQYRRVLAFVLHLGKRDQIRTAAEMGTMFLGFPTITDQPLAENEKIRDWYISEPDYDKMVKLALELRGIKTTNLDINLPINHGPAFEGETIRKGDAYLEMGGGKTTAFELVRMVDADSIDDGKVEVIGPEIDDFAEGARMPFGLVVDIYGRKMQQDFEGVLERRIHYFVNYGEGLWHVAQRDLAWLRISKEAAAKGFKLKHYGELLIAKFKSEFPAIVDRVQVHIYTEQNKVEEMLNLARKRYAERDDRLRGLTDDTVDTLYSCLLCQSFAPNHVCIVTPERVGLCGAVSWLDAKASYEINPTGPNQPIPKGEAIDEKKGMYKNINEYYFRSSNGTLEEVNLYTMLDKPMTSCGCFEAIIAIVPELNGIMITTREHSGMTPVGMTFSSLAGMIGGGIQTPGFMGIGRTYITSRKFIRADGGIARIVWMPKELKEYLRADFAVLCEENGLGDDFIDKIADENIGTTIEEITPFLMEKGHPALTMESII